MGSGPPPAGNGHRTSAGAGWDAIGQRISGAGPAASPSQPPPTCTVCGATLAADQTYCLACGSPTPLAPRLGRPRRGVGVVAAGLVVLGLGTGALAYAVSDGEGSPQGTVTSTSTSTVTRAPTVPGVVTTPQVGPLPPDFSAQPPPTTTGAAPTGEPFPVVTGPGGTALPDPFAEPPDLPASPVPDPGDLPPLDPLQPAPSTPSPRPGSASGGGSSGPTQGAASDWPAGRDAWTVQVASARSRAEAEEVEGRLRALGEPAGVLISGDHPELRPGYFVVFSGVLGSRQAALAQAASLEAAFPESFARHITG